MALVGGDTKPGPVPTVVSSVVGWARDDALAPRSGARPGDLVATTGTVGRGGVAAAHLLGTRRPDRAALVEMLDVRPRVVEGKLLSRRAHAMLDTSDGLADAARLLAAASQVRVEVDWARLPLAARIRSGSLSAGEAQRRAFYGGDYELLLALPPRRFPSAQRSVRAAGGRLTAIGTVARGHGAWLRVGPRVRPMPPAGWKPFARRRT